MRRLYQQFRPVMFEFLCRRRVRALDWLSHLRVPRHRAGARLSAQRRLSAKCCRWPWCLPFENDDLVSLRQNLEGELVLGAE